MTIRPGVPPARADGDRLQHGLLSLIAHAVRYTRQGTITLRATGGAPLSTGVVITGPYVVMQMIDCTLPRATPSG